MKKLLYISLCLLALISCGGGAQKQKVQPLKAFPLPEVPSVFQTGEQRQEYVMQHYWDAFFAADGRCDTSAVLGVATADVESSLAGFIQFLDNFPMEQAQSFVDRFFHKMEAKQAADTSSHMYLLMSEMVARYLYDPNSPYRNEDYFLPFVKGLAASAMTPEAYRAGYVFEARMCAMNPYGSTAPDFSFTDLGGRTHRMSDVKADYTVLFFSNPGCGACRDIIDQLTQMPWLDPLIAMGKIAVVNIYIDEELDKWREYAPSYPSNWHTGYDHRLIIRSDELYNVRAIPSLYLLDSEKHVIMKDAPTEKVLSFLDNFAKQPIS